MKPATCPHCNTSANPLRPSLYIASATYTCAACGHKSHFDRRKMGIIGSVGIIAGSLVKELFGLGGFIAFTVAIASVFILAGIIYLSLRLIPDQK